jgi:hypothetical protein
MQKSFTAGQSPLALIFSITQKITKKNPCYANNRGFGFENRLSWRLKLFSQVLGMKEKKGD